jgi:hypothetical protein
MLKHVGRMAKNKRKIVVAYRVVPNEPDNCIVVTTENLMAEEHDALMKLVESDAGQSEEHLASAMARSRMPDGKIMLAALHTTGKMVKVATADVEMTPNSNTVIKLSELNEVIAEQKGVTVADLAVQDNSPAAKQQQSTTSTEPTSIDNVLSDEDLAAQYRSQADSLFKEAKRLREQAEELVPTKKKAKTKAKEGVG